MPTDLPKPTRRQPGRRRHHGDKPPATNGRPTMDDVARIAGVSRATVSRVINGFITSARTRDAVQHAIRQTNYVVNHHARSLVTRRAQSALFALAEGQQQLFEDANFNLLLRAARRTLAAQEISLVMSITGDGEETSHIERLAAGGHMDGALLVSAAPATTLMDRLADGGLPVVACGRPLGRHQDMSYVTVDDRGAARQIVRYLQEQGRRRIAVITGPPDTPGARERLAGYQDALGDQLDPRLIGSGGYTQASGEEAMHQLLARSPEVDAVFAASGPAALGALAALRLHGRRVPTDVAVAGFDDPGPGTREVPGLTTIGFPFEEVGTTMATLLLDLLKGEAWRRVVLPTRLVIRETA